MELKKELFFEDFKQMEALEGKYYDQEYITPAEEAFKWYQYEPESIRVVCEGESIIGFCNMFPVREQIYELIEQGLFNDSLLSYQDIYRLNEKTEFIYVFLSCILVEESYRGEGVTQLLVREYWKYFNEWVKKGVKVVAVITDNVTAEGENFSKKIGLQLHRVSNHDSKIYQGTFEAFTKANRYLNV